MIYDIRYNDIVPTVITYPNPDKTNNNAPSEKKYYPNPSVYTRDYPNPSVYTRDYNNNYFNPNVYLYPELNPYYSTYPRLFNEPSVYEYQNVNKDDTLRDGVVKFFQEKIIKWIKTKKEFANFNKNEIESREGYKKLYKTIRKFVNHKKYNWYDLRENYEKLRKYIANNY